MLDSQLVTGVFAGLVICYFLFLKRYRNHLIYKYNYDFLGIPTFIAVAGPVIHTLMAWAGPAPDYSYYETYEAVLEAIEAGLITPEPDVLTIVQGLLLYATPGVFIATIVCLVKTRNLGITILNIPLQYIIAVVAGGAIAVAIMTIIVLILLKSFASRASSITRGTDQGGVCPVCKTRVSGPGVCPGCQTELY